MTFSKSMKTTNKMCSDENKYRHIICLYSVFVVVVLLKCECEPVWGKTKECGYLIMCVRVCVCASMSS